MKTLPINGSLREEVVAALGESPWFRALRERAAAQPEAERQVDLLIASADLTHYESGEMVLREGYPSDSFHVLVRGAVRVHTGDADNPRDLGRLQRPAAFGEVGLLLDEPRTATVVAHGEVLALSFTATAFHDVFEKIPEFGLDTSRHLARRLRDVTGLIPPPAERPAGPKAEEFQGAE